MKQRIGIYSGTFDPIHQGHVTFALETMRLDHLDKVVFLPEPSPRNKPNVTDIIHRVALIQRAISDYEKLSVIQPISKQFSVNATLPELRSLFADDDLTLLVGSDVVRSFPYQWENVNVLLETVRLAIGMRGDDTSEEVIDIITQLEDTYNLQVTYSLIKTDDSGIASSHIRRGTQQSDTLHPSVSDYVKKHNLYM